MRRYLAMVLVLSSVASYAVDKNSLDISVDRSDKSGAFSSSSGLTRPAADPNLSLTLLRGGYFTIGTVAGLSVSDLDDRCGVSFGHPFAMTSYPVISVDGEWMKPDDYYDGEGDLKPTDGGGAGILVQGDGDGLLSFSFSLRLDGASVLASLKMTNKGDVSRDIGMGVVFDPALGKWGDGYLQRGSRFLEQDTLFTGSGVPDRIVLWERQSGAKGMGVELAFPVRKPSQIDAANWPDVYEGPGPGFQDGGARKLYDLCLKMCWEGKRLTPGQADSIQVRFSLTDPDFGSGAFLRWDIPSAVSITDNVLFPRELDTHVEINGPGAPVSGTGQIIVETGSGLRASGSEVAVAFTGEPPVTQKVTLRSMEVYEPTVAEAGVALMQGARVLDVVARNVFIPATAKSDTGLNVQIDSMITSGFPEVRFAFHADAAATGIPVRELYPENVFLYEDGARISKFTVGDDTTGGRQELDLVFVLDVTGSMGGTIDGVKTNIIEFADSLKMRRVDFRLALVTFLDAVENVYSFTPDVNQFKAWISDQFAHEGGDGPENSLDALVRASELPFRPKARRVFIWITDINYHEADWATARTKQDVIPILVSKGITVHAVGEQSQKSEYYDPILLATGGNYYNIYGNFRDILLEISRLRANFRYMLSYRSGGAASAAHRIGLELHTAGLGGYAEKSYPAPGPLKAGAGLECYPNPFNQTVLLRVRTDRAGKSEIRIHDVLGRTIRRIRVSGGGTQDIRWDACDDRRFPVPTGFYVVRLVSRESGGGAVRAERKILYLK
jgi:Mg-chelatase subunit ChlD